MHVGHDAANLGDADTVIHTGAIWPENPEYVTAKERGLPVIHRSQALYWLIGGAASSRSPARTARPRRPA